MPALFLRKSELADFLGITLNQAIAILEEHGVKPVDLGRGRGHGLRWRTSAVTRVADALHAQAQEQTAKPHHSRVSRPLRGRSVDELFGEFNKGGTPVQ